MYKIQPGNMIKALNLKDGMEMIIDSQTGHIENYMALVYSFQTTQESFYDKKTGQQYVSDVTERLQNFYENTRRKIFLKNKFDIKTTSIDKSARAFKGKYMIEKSYTLLDLRFFNQYLLSLSKSTDLMLVMKQMSDAHIKKLVHNYFPGSHATLLHLIAENTYGFNSVDHLSDRCKKEGYIVPLMPNSAGLTPVDVVVKSRDYKQCNSLVRMLGKAPIDHHARFISHLIPTLINQNLPALQKYFDKRKYQTGLCKSINVGRLRVSKG